MSTSLVTWLDPDLAARLSNVRDDDAPVHTRNTNPLCSIPGCVGPVRCRGWCKAHYDHWRLRGDPEWAPARMPETCLFPGCDRDTKAVGLCAGHYWHMRPEAHGPMSRKCRAIAAAARMRPKYERQQNGSEGVVSHRKGEVKR